MALKFLNKKGWHTGSLRNIERVWKAEQKHEAEEKKLDELRKQIQEEKERNEFRLLQEQAGLVPKQERLEFLYDSGLAVGKSANSEGFKALEAFPKADASATPSSSAPSSVSKQQQSSAPGALFEDKPHSANDAWRKLHSDPLLMIRQREQDALARIKNNPVQMAMIRKTVEGKKHMEKNSDKKERHRKKRKHSSSKHQSDSVDQGRKRMTHKDSSSDREDESSEKEMRKKKNHHRDVKYRGQSPSDISRQKNVRDKDHDIDQKNYEKSMHERYSLEDNKDMGPSRRYDEMECERERKIDWDRGSERERERDMERERVGERGRERERERVGERGRERERERVGDRRREKERERDTERERAGDRRRERERERDMERDRVVDMRRERERGRNMERERVGDRGRESGKERRGFPEASSNISNVTMLQHEPHRRKKLAPKLTEEERASKLQEMQLAAELHEEQRWKRLKKADEEDAKEATQSSSTSGGKNFLHDAQKSVYGAGQGGSSTIAESVRRRTYYSQGRSEASEGNAFRR